MKVMVPAVFGLFTSVLNQHHFQIEPFATAASVLSSLAVDFGQVVVAASLVRVLKIFLGNTELLPVIHGLILRFGLPVLLIRLCESLFIYFVQMVQAGILALILRAR
jgi:hypothetical protein